MEIKINVEDLKKQRLFLGTPMYGGVCTGMFAKSTADLSVMCSQYGIPFQCYFLFNESLITRARNYVCDEFMRSESEVLMFIDSDIGYNPQDVIAMAALMAQDDKYDVIGGPYPKKCISWEKIKMAVDKGFADQNCNELEKFVGDFVFNPKGGQHTIAISEPAEVLELGTGFMMIRKSAMKRFMEAYPQHMYKPDHVRTEHFDGSREIMQFFQAEIDRIDYGAEYKKILEDIVENGHPNVDVAKAMKDVEDRADKKSKRYLSEDYWFCQMAQNIGLRTWLCPWMKLQHVGTYIFGGSLADLASIGAAATADPSKLGGKKK